MNFLTLQFLLLNLCVAWIACQGEDTATENKITGKDLVDMGLKFNKHLLRLFGKALMGVECRGQACSSWTEWSACDLFVGQFGMRKRSRLCGDQVECGTKTRETNETDTQVCQLKQRQCPSDYDRINGFCLKLYKDITKNKADAESSCVSDSGHLVNINTEQMWTAVASLLEKYKFTNFVYIDGQRKDNTSPWTFTYETDVTGYTNWASGGEPHNNVNAECLFALKTPSRAGLLDGTCTSNWNFVCEVV